MKVNTDKSFAGVFYVTARFILARAHCDLGYFSFCYLFYLTPRRKVEMHINLGKRTESHRTKSHRTKMSQDKKSQKKKSQSILFTLADKKSQSIFFTLADKKSQDKKSQVFAIQNLLVTSG